MFTKRLDHRRRGFGVEFGSDIIGIAEHIKIRGLQPHEIFVNAFVIDRIVLAYQNRVGLVLMRVGVTGPSSGRVVLTSGSGEIEILFVDKRRQTQLAADFDCGPLSAIFGVFADKGGC